MLDIVGYPVDFWLYRDGFDNATREAKLIVSKTECMGTVKEV